MLFHLLHESGPHQKAPAGDAPDLRFLALPPRASDRNPAPQIGATTSGSEASRSQDSSVPRGASTSKPEPLQHPIHRGTQCLLLLRPLSALQQRPVGDRLKQLRIRGCLRTIERTSCDHNWWSTTTSCITFIIFSSFIFQALPKNLQSATAPRLALHRRRPHSRYRRNFLWNPPRLGLR